MSFRSKRLIDEPTFTEPDLMPIMNICLMLILAVISMSAFLPLGFISAESPSLSNAAGGKASSKPVLSLTVFVNQNGFDLSVNGKLRKGKGKSAYIAKISKGSEKVYDYIKLNAVLSGIKGKHPKDLSIFLSADPNVPYEDIVRTMDASRRKKDGSLLFPNVAFVAGITS